MLGAGVDVVDVDDAASKGVSNGVCIVTCRGIGDVGDTIGLDCSRNLETFVMGSCSRPQRMLGRPEGDGYVDIKIDVYAIYSAISRKDANSSALILT